jgi:hypothetical protein
MLPSLAGEMLCSRKAVAKGGNLSVYVDNARNRFGGMVMCHMIADAADELHALAIAIGLRREWFQHKASIPHYDVCIAKRAKAIQAGAVELERDEFVAVARRVRAAIVAGRWHGRATHTATRGVGENLDRVHALCAAVAQHTGSAWGAEQKQRFVRAAIDAQLAADDMVLRLRSLQRRERELVAALDILQRKMEQLASPAAPRG